MASAQKVKDSPALVRLNAKAQCRSALRMSTRPDIEPTHARYTLSSAARGSPSQVDHQVGRAANASGRVLELTRFRGADCSIFERRGPEG